MTTQLTFAPRSALLDHFRKGWRTIPCHTYNPDDWAILLYMPDVETPAPEQMMRGWVARFVAPRPAPLSNKSAAARWGGKILRERAVARRLEMEAA